jgi:hypothetical protein
MSGIPPVPTFVPQDAWYALTVGNYNPSEANSVPNAGYLSPAGGQNGLVGSLDGGLIYLRGTTNDLDGGQQWLMWIAASMLTADGITVFNPWVASGVPGRWVSTTQPSIQGGPGGQIVTTGGAAAVALSDLSPINVVVQLTIPAPITVYLPSGPRLWQEFRIIDGYGISDPNFITVSGNGQMISGLPQRVITPGAGTLRVVWGGVQYNLL